MNKFKKRIHNETYEYVNHKLHRSFMVFMIKSFFSFSHKIKKNKATNNYPIFDKAYIIR